MLYALPVFLPLIGAIVAGFFGRQIGDRGAQLATCIPMGLSLLLATILLFTVPGTEGGKVELLRWISAGTFEASWTLRVDALTAVMLFVVTSVSFLVHVYSVGYMSHDPSIPRFMAYLSLFTFAMLMLVTADNFIQLYFGWEGVGLASYLLIGFWYHKPSACAAAIKAFVVNRVGDFGLALGIAAIYLVFDSVQFDTVFAAAPSMVGTEINVFGMSFDTLTLICLLLFVGAMGKSAQLPLHTWLADAMEGPTPVSALIHAATMVTAGVFLVARVSPMMEYAPTALAFVTFIGASTAIFAATIGLTQFDIKRVIAYSTCSQLGYMFFACGVGAYPAAIFHLFTHAFFKALLFLGSGSVIHAMSDEQDMRKMGGIWKLIPYTYAMMWIGSLALAGIPWFAGYYSKDLVIETAWAAHTGIGNYAFAMGVLAALLTAFYSWRLLFMTFHGEPRASHDTMHHVHESPLVMTVPLGLLAFGAITAGFLGFGMAEGHEFWGGSIFMGPANHVIEHAHHAPAWVKLAPLVMSALGIALAFLFYIVKTDLPAKLVSAVRPVHTFLFNKWYFDELYDAVFVRPSKRIGTALWQAGDVFVIDGFGPNGVAATAWQVARQTTRLQTGYLYHYAFVMLIGVALLVTWYMLAV
ncbi:NADH-quinone oxidoreductase subunit L [Marinivivus vitaminiproducens]|uniref:NADH-quinone oxidoreductase subunit L n=1 Tax=Marinivivus vitaminiproducens TaxID=3035935 RepID=UPI0027A262E0|nr:NADH-quinone oxidoreductase subunit L [Geminicoccaceae bacterium SCSIO 64248]